MIMVITCEMTTLDEMIQGFNKGNLYRIQSKESLLCIGCNLAMKIAIEEQHSMLYFSLSYSNTEVVACLTSLKSGIPLEQIGNGRLEDRQYESLTETVDLLSASHLYIDDTPSFELQDVCSKIKDVHREHTLEYVVIEGLSIDESEEKSSVIQELDLLAIELNVIIVIATA